MLAGGRASPRRSNAGSTDASLTAAGLQAPNRAHDLRTYFRPGGIEVVPRQQSAGGESWRFTWTTSRWGRGDRMQAVEPTAAKPQAAGTRVLYARPGFEEWYENGKTGLEQGFTVQVRPAGTGGLCLEGQLGGALHAELRADAVVDLIDECCARVVLRGAASRGR